MANGDNSRTGTNFEREVLAFFGRRGVVLRPNVVVRVGFGDSKKGRRFDLGSEDPPVLVECKCHTWTAGGNSPSAKLTIWNEAMLYFSVAPRQYGKLLVVQKSVRGETPLVEHYIARFEHLIPSDVEIWELDTIEKQGRCVRPVAAQHFRATSSLLQALNVPESLVVEFFITFARFEFALKQAGFVQGDGTMASPDWDRFARQLAKQSGAVLAPVVVQGEYILENPPRKQVLEGGHVIWTQPNRDRSDIENLLLNIRTVRNNVFHGGKFPVGMVAEPMRDQHLIRGCLAVLNAVLEQPDLPNDLAGHFQVRV